jgi:hypothetical protein
MGRLVFDIDGVIANFVDGFLAYADELGGYEGMPCCWREVKEYNFFPGPLFKQIANDTSFWLGLRRMPGVRLKMITEGIFPDLYLTARPIDNLTTMAWLSRNLFPIAKVVTVNSPYDKIRYLEAGDVLVDDHPGTIRAAEAIGVKALLMDAPFHRGEPAESLDGLTVIKCVSEVAPYISDQQSVVSGQ